MSISRRHFLKLSGALSLALSTPILVSKARADSAPVNVPVTDVDFDCGIASGDPGCDRVMLWTRATPKAQTPSVTIEWDIATDQDFRHIVRSGTATTFPHRDYTVKIDVQELAENQVYFYRFKGQNGYSASGKTRTLAKRGIDHLKLAVFSCSNYPAGYFHAYREAVKNDDIDFTLHLGDYIYEYGSGGYATEQAAELGRSLAADNNGELFTLQDYRKRYQLYRQDQDLQLMHAAAPCIAVWDDHEISNDTWIAGAENHDASEGDFFARRAAAIQAYYEWMPIRPPEGEQSLRIYRSFDFGQLFSLHMLDTRIIKRTQQLEYRNFMDPENGHFDASGFQTRMAEYRALLGHEQREWLRQQIETSPAHWQIIGQQLLMSRMQLPAEMMANQDLTRVPQLLADLVPLKQRALAGESLSDEERRRISQVMPYNLDAWDGYAVEREMVYRDWSAAGKPVVVLAGDTHNAWHNVLRNQQGEQVAVEFATSSVSSPGMEYYLKLDQQNASQTAAAMQTLIDDLQYCNLHQRGFMTLTIRPDTIDVEWVFIDSVHQRDYRVAGRHALTHRS
ncbi:alkaline phosphatase [Aliidiomarina sedimenti]|uniref:Alkaline phosphatase n=1 Tax=Aliidiomarina sedimenti TaxID=1933879 RepID=A0ABY0BYA9_9GAMM|nr:alkaline phosphatase D family protein [Aliidiomarina sedimenti]RUO29751.1 alkaline phosphatase [Aliidiomarina sedimenti]